MLVVQLWMIISLGEQTRAFIFQQHSRFTICETQEVEGTATPAEQVYVLRCAKRTIANTPCVFPVFARLASSLTTPACYTNTAPHTFLREGTVKRLDCIPMSQHAHALAAFCIDKSYRVCSSLDLSFDGNTELQRRESKQPARPRLFPVSTAAVERTALHLLISSFFYRRGRLGVGLGRS